MGRNIQALLKKMKQIDKLWYKNYIKAKQYKLEYGDINYTFDREDTLSIWLYKQRFLYRNNKLSEDKIILLDELNIEWDSLYSTALKYIEELDIYIENNGSLKNLPENLQYTLIKLENILKNNNYIDIEFRLNELKEGDIIVEES